jgi:hypothetical protein
VDQALWWCAAIEIFRVTLTAQGGAINSSVIRLLGMRADVTDHHANSEVV